MAVLDLDRPIVSYSHYLRGQATVLVGVDAGVAVLIWVRYGGVRLSAFSVGGFLLAYCCLHGCVS